MSENNEQQNQNDQNNFNNAPNNNNNNGQDQENQVNDFQENENDQLLTPGNYDSEVDVLSYDDILQRIDMGKYQLKIYLIFGLIGITEGSQITVFTFMVPILRNYWGVDDDLNSLATSIVFVGFLLGSLMSGFFSDRFGRQLPIQITVTLAILFVLAQAFVRDMFQLIVIRGFLGLTIGFQGPLGATMLTEITPKTVRGRYMSLIQLSISLGQLYGLLIGSLTLESTSTGNWRAMIIWTGFPGLFAIACIFLFLDESAMFLLQHPKSHEKAFKIIDKMNETNNGDESPFTEQEKNQLALWVNQHLEKENDKDEVSISLLFEGDNLCFLTPIIWFNWFVVSFLYYGIIVLLPLLLDEVNHQESILGENVFLKLSFSSSSEILAACLAAYLIELKGLGRKNSMILFFTLTGSILTLVYYDEISRFEMWAMTAKFFLTMTIIFAYQYTAEVYPTKIRTTGIGVANGIGKLGGVIMPWICLFLVSIDQMSPFLLFAILSVFTALLDIQLPFDTLGRDLDS